LRGFYISPRDCSVIDRNGNIPRNGRGSMLRHGPTGLTTRHWMNTGFVSSFISLNSKFKLKFVGEIIWFPPGTNPEQSTVFAWRGLITESTYLEQLASRIARMLLNDLRSEGFHKVRYEIATAYPLLDSELDREMTEWTSYFDRDPKEDLSRRWADLIVPNLESNGVKLASSLKSISWPQETSHHQELKDTVEASSLKRVLLGLSYDQEFEQMLEEVITSEGLIGPRLPPTPEEEEIFKRINDFFEE